MRVDSQHTENHVAHLCIFVEDAASCLRLTALVYQSVQAALRQSSVPVVQRSDTEHRQGFVRPLLRSGLTSLPEEAESLAGVADGYLPKDTLLVVSPQDDRLCLRIDHRPPIRPEAEKEALFVVRFVLGGG